eukprot:TRINITY_DN782197_c0_g1_i1.p1 TRINITY_DN782197_c0_g1~~TRINITY_DN782197_c0_g1_i1.p1  ORF type:complete len:247 (-),score=41.72 TRINITY_DN782197_c0_g1_i1:166-906(-)
MSAISSRKLIELEAILAKTNPLLKHLTKCIGWVQAYKALSEDSWESTVFNGPLFCMDYISGERIILLKSQNSLDSLSLPVTAEMVCGRTDNYMFISDTSNGTFAFWCKDNDQLSDFHDHVARYIVSLKHEQEQNVALGSLNKSIKESLSVSPSSTEKKFKAKSKKKVNRETLLSSPPRVALSSPPPKKQMRSVKQSSKKPTTKIAHDDILNKDSKDMFREAFEKCIGDPRFVALFSEKLQEVMETK